MTDHGNPAFHAVVDNASGSVLRYGATVLTPGPGQTLHTNVGPLPSTGPHVIRHYTIDRDTRQIRAMTPDERAVAYAVDMTRAAAESRHAIVLHRTYATAVDLPPTPHRDGLLVLVVNARDLKPALALSFHNLWYMFYPE